MKNRIKKPNLTFKLLKERMKIKSDDYVFNYTNVQQLRYFLDIYTVEKNVKG